MFNRVDQMKSLVEYSIVFGVFFVLVLWAVVVVNGVAQDNELIELQIEKQKLENQLLKEGVCDGNEAS